MHRAAGYDHRGKDVSGLERGRSEHADSDPDGGDGNPAAEGEAAANARLCSAAGHSRGRTSVTHSTRVNRRVGRAIS